jgi:hypothetical protein
MTITERIFGLFKQITIKNPYYVANKQIFLGGDSGKPGTMVVCDNRQIGPKVARRLSLKPKPA